MSGLPVVRIKLKDMEEAAAPPRELKKPRHWQQHFCAIPTISGEFLALRTWHSDQVPQLGKPSKSHASPPTLATTTSTAVTENKESPPKQAAQAQQHPEKQLNTACTFEGCIKMFQDEPSMKKHYTLVHTAKEVKCRICDIKFADRGSLTRHQLSEHKKPAA